MADLYATPVYALLEKKAREFISRHPQLLVQPWLRNCGAVRDLIEAVGNEVREAEKVLARSRLPKLP